MKTTLHVAAMALLAFTSTRASADDKADCLDAATRGQTMRNEHELVEAREQLLICARASCPAVVQRDCANWLDSVERALPTVVIAAKNGAGEDLVDVKVSVDGRPLAAKLDGQAVAMDPGPHAFHFEASDGTSIDHRFVVKEGEQNQPVAVLLGPPGHSPGPEPSQGTRTWKTVGWVLGGVGVVGLAVGTVFGVMAITDHSDAQCNSNHQCLSGPLGDARTAARVSDVGLLAGGLLLAGGAALVLFAPTGSSEGRGVAFTVTPAIGPKSGGVALGGTF
jgi:hypothetical protein